MIFRRRTEKIFLVAVSLLGRHFLWAEAYSSSEISIRRHSRQYSTILCSNSVDRLGNAENLSRRNFLAFTMTGAGTIGLMASGATAADITSRLSTAGNGGNGQPNGGVSKKVGGLANKIRGICFQMVSRMNHFYLPLCWL